jgi:predicted DNA-binding antitoxin AbrB/MazE fold protein
VEQKPVSEAREMFEPSRAPGVRSAPKRPTDEAPLFKVSKIQKPAEQPKREKFTDKVQMEIVDQRPLPEFTKKIPLYGIPVDEPDMQQEKRVKSSTEMRIPKFGVPVEDQVAPPTKQTLYLKEKPRFTKPLRDTKVKEGEKVKLEVAFKGQPEPIVKWYRDDAEIQSSTDFEISYSDEGTSLSIAEVFPEDQGRFKCVITNADGSATSEANLAVLRKFS